MTFHLALYFTLPSLLCHSQGSHKSLRNRRFWRLTLTNNRQYPSSWTKSCEDYNCFDRIVCIAYSKVSVAQSAQSFQVAICTATSCLWWTFELFVTRHLNSTTVTRVLNCYSQLPNPGPKTLLKYQIPECPSQVWYFRLPWCGGWAVSQASSLASCCPWPSPHSSSPSSQSSIPSPRWVLTSSSNRRHVREFFL